MTPDELFDLPPGATVRLDGRVYERRDVVADSGEPEFIDWLGDLYDADDLDGAEVMSEQ